MKILPLLLTGLLLPIPAMADDARVSLDWEGRYEGVFPRASCPGVKTVLMLDQDGTYQLVETYQSDKDEQVVENGTFTWNEAGDHIILDGNGKRAFLVSEGQLVALNADGEAGGDEYVMAQTKVPLTAADYPPPPSFDEIKQNGAEFIGGGQNLKIHPNSAVRSEKEDTGDTHVVFDGLQNFEFQMEGGHKSLTATYDINCTKGQYDLPVIAYFREHDAKGQKLFETSDNAGNWLDLPEESDDALAQAAEALCH